MDDVQKAGCFVVSPLGDQYADANSDPRMIYERSVELYEEIISAAAKEIGLHTYRASDISESGSITAQIVEALRESRLVVADLTGLNPNVMYEVGMRHAYAKPCVLICEAGYTLPFDLGGLRTIFFKDSPSGRISARKSLVKALGKALVDNEVSPIDLKSQGEVDIAGEDVDHSESEELGFIEQLVEMEEALPELNDQLHAASSLIEKTSAFATKYSVPLTEADSFAKKLRAIKAFASELSPVAASLDDVSIEVRAKVASIDRGLSTLFDILSNDKAQIPDVEDFLLTIVDMGGVGAREGIAGMKVFRDGAQTLLSSSSDLRDPVKMLTAAVDRMMEGFQVMVSWSSQAEALLAQAPGRSEGLSAS